MIVENPNKYKLVKLDLSEGSTISNDVKELTMEAFETYLFNEVLECKIGYGGYLEKRNFYQRSKVFKNSENELFRNIHLGVDIWASVNSKVYSPLDAEVHSFANNNNPQDYGATIILKTASDDEQIHMLFGHLSLESLEFIKTKTKIKKGEQIGWLGNQAENGGWPPHLHFQLIKDMQGKQGDYIGVCAEKDIPFYKENCPNPYKLITF